MAISKFKNYTLETYKKDLNSFGIKRTWTNILKYRKSHADEEVVNILRTCNFGELYEIGLAHVSELPTV